MPPDEVFVAMLDECRESYSKGMGVDICAARFRRRRQRKPTTSKRMMRAMLPITDPTTVRTGVELFVVAVLVAETEIPVVVDVASNDADVDGEVLVAETEILVVVDVASDDVHVGDNVGDVDVEESIPWSRSRICNISGIDIYFIAPHWKELEERT
jgi:hypothetical protein